MACRYNYIIIANVISFYYAVVHCRGLLLLYRPTDITFDCAASDTLRYDLSFGMGMSDTITVVLRTLTDVDYECQVDITTDRVNKLIAVIRFPNAIGYNCEHNPQAFHVMKYDNRIPVCDEAELLVQDVFSNYLTIFTQGRFRFLFKSNSSINSDINAYLYEVTVTTARLREGKSCFSTVNETECFSPHSNQYYCMTSGVVCDGIKNCGAEDWYDERLSECEVPMQTLGYPPIFAVVSLMLCTMVALAHILKRCLPHSTSFFIYNTNEDNRLCIDPVFNRTGKGTFENSESYTRRKSLVPINWSDTEDTDEDEPNSVDLQNAPLSRESGSLITVEANQLTSVKSYSLCISSRISSRLRSVMGYYLPGGGSNTTSSEEKVQDEQQKSSKRVKHTRH